jgi:hypothetical protein
MTMAMALARQGVLHAMFAESARFAAIEANRDAEDAAD